MVKILNKFMVYPTEYKIKWVEFLTHASLGNLLIQSTLLFYFNFTNTLDIKESYNEVKNRLLTLMYNSWKIWPIVHYFNFFWIPINYRIAFINFIWLNWNIYLNWFSFN